MAFSCGRGTIVRWLLERNLGRRLVPRAFAHHRQVYLVFPHVCVRIMYDRKHLFCKGTSCTCTSSASPKHAVGSSSGAFSHGGGSPGRPPCICTPVHLALQGYLAHEKQPPRPPLGHHMALGICCCRVLRGGCFLRARYPSIAS